ncbi:MAG: hypothetical protein HYS34_00710 [Acidobacteria bacterium]|nr:hypothetical protein [Acidobacteriota bacterium]
MRRTPRIVVVAVPAVCLSAAILFQPAHLGTSFVPPPAPVRHTTVEPTLPLRLDLEVHEGLPGRGEPARVEAMFLAAADLLDVSLHWVLPEGLERDGAAGLQTLTPLMRSGERRLVEVPVRALRAGDFAIRLEASFRLADGRQYRTQQGVLWRRGPAAPAGRHHAGAYEVMGVPVSEPLP